MHVLIVNDDGPPSNQSSPYVHSLVKILQDAGHTVSVILPHVQRSWIGKAHFVGHVTKPTYFRPGTLHKDDGTTHARPLPDGVDGEEWVLVNGTPATCVQLGLHHFFQDRDPVDLVVSGPNYGRNSTALFSLSSGTIGGAMEAAVCRKKAIALSYAFYSRDHDPMLIAGASRLSVKLIEHLYNRWDQDVDLYTINVPLIEGVEKHKILYANTLQNYWSSGSSFQEIDATSDEDEVKPGKEEKDIRSQLVPSNNGIGSTATRHRHKHFKWTPKFTDIHKSIEENPPGNDGWALTQGFTSVTPLKANFMHASSSLQGELKLPLDLHHEILQRSNSCFYAYINYQDDYVQPLILSAFQTQLPPSSYIVVPSTNALPNSEMPIVQITSYEDLDFSHLLAHPRTSFTNAYIIRKALIRKHYLANTVTTWLAKNPDSPLKHHVKPTLDFELDYAEFLDEAILEAYELHESFSRNSNKEPVDRGWWILKPSMSDRGQGIRLFSTEQELRDIFEQWENELPDSDSEDEHDTTSLPETSNPSFDPTAPILNANNLSEVAEASNGIVTSQLRHFVVQPYIHPPLLFPSHQNRKFHIRSYVLAVGALRVYVYKDMLALFAATSYTAPGSTSSNAFATDPDLRAHLTNTCLQDGHREGSVHRFWDLPSSLPNTSTTSSTDTMRLSDWRTTTFAHVCSTTSALFHAAALSQQIHFQTLPSAFEIFGVDWMVDECGGTWLLEVNAFPDFRQTGDDLRGVVAGLWEGVVRVGVAGLVGLVKVKGDGEQGDEGMKLVLDLDMGRG